MIKQQYKVNNTDIIVTLDEPYTFGEGFRNRVINGLERNYTWGTFTGKCNKNIVGRWKKKDDGRFFIKLWQKCCK